jgi:murein L,D-transpeptidase YcbB/YkuD
MQTALIKALSGPPFTRYREDVTRFYATAQYQPAWLTGDAPTPQAIAILAELKDAGAKGLRPEDYEAPDAFNSFAPRKPGVPLPPGLTLH